MPASNSFDVVSEYDKQEMTNTVDQTDREIKTRYDLKDAKCSITLADEKIELTAESEYQLNTIYDLLQSKAIKRGISLKVFKRDKVEDASGGTVRQTIELVKGIADDLAKQISKQIREAFPKAQSQIQGESLRVTSKSRDELQEIITFLKGKDYPVALQFNNFR